MLPILSLREQQNIAQRFVGSVSDGQKALHLFVVAVQLAALRDEAVSGFYASAFASGGSCCHQRRLKHVISVILFRCTPPVCTNDYLMWLGMFVVVCPHT